MPRFWADQSSVAGAAGRRHRQVFAPARDGGYWLVGVRNRGLLRGLFRNVRWSSEHTLTDTIANLPAGRRHVLVDKLEDVDDAGSWRRWRYRISRR